jgi:putative transposase
VECVLGVPFGYGFNEEVRKFLEDFRDMVNFCIDYAYRRGITSYARLGKGVYGGGGRGDGIILLISATQPVR